MILHTLSALLLVFPMLVTAAIFPPDTKVKMLDPKGFKRVMKNNRTSVVAFVAPWCGHCKQMAPEYSKAARNLSPLVPFYAIDCDAESNKQLCASQEVQGFPTVKVFPRGGQLPGQKYESGERTSNNLIKWASRSVPNKIKVFSNQGDIPEWLDKVRWSDASRQNVDLPRVILLNRDKKFPLLWQVLGNNYYKKIAFGHHSDPKGNFAASLGFTAREEGKLSKVVVYPAGLNVPILYEGGNKYEPLFKYFRSIVDGTVDFLKAPTESPAKDEL
ncbi:thioredoxin-like protein [Boletus coccyginus]|nr:thioredoxin-like protein [Boletus coccyginus]